MARMKVSNAPSIRRLPSYLHIIRQSRASGDFYISGTVIAQELNLEPIQVRKDLSITGIVGKPKKGYPVEALVAAIERYLGWDRPTNAIVVGAGNLGSALMGYPEFQQHGLKIVAAFDQNPVKVGTMIHGVQVYHTDKLEDMLPGLQAHTAILAVPSDHAQVCVERLVAAGINAVWNFTNQKLRTPDKVVVQREDLSSGFAMLSVMTQIRDGRGD